MSDEDFIDALDFLLDLPIGNSSTDSISSNSGDDYDDTEYRNEVILKSNKRRIYLDEGVPRHSNNDRELIKLPNKKSYAPLYSQQYGLALDAPYRFSNRFAYGFNFNDSNVLAEQIDSLFARNARMVHRVYGVTDPNTGRARNQFGNFTMIEFDPVCQFYDVMRQCYELSPDLVFKVFSFQSMQTRSGSVVINFAFEHKGTIIQKQSAVTFEAKVTDAVFDNTVPSVSVGGVGSCIDESAAYDAEATALMSELEGARIIDENLLEFARDFKDKSPTMSPLRTVANDKDDEEIVERFDYTPLAERPGMSNPDSYLTEEELNMNLTQAVEETSKPLHISGLISLTLDKDGKIATMEFFYQHLT